MSRSLILIVGPTPPPYFGMSMATEVLLRAMGQRIRYVHLDTADRRGLANIGKFELGNLLLAAKHGAKCLWILLTKWPDVVYVPISQAWLPFLRDCLFLIPAKLLRRKVVIHLHGGYFGTFYHQAAPVMRWIVRCALGSAACGIVLGKSVAAIFNGIVPSERVRIVPNGIPDHFRDRHGQKREKYHPHTLLFLGMLMPGKGYVDLLRALPLVRERLGAVQAVFAGEWCSQRDKESAEQLVDRFELGSSVQFIGPVGAARKRELLETSDVFVFPSAHPEGQPFVILEAMAAGLPVVSTNWACIPEMVAAGVNGLLVNPGDIEGLAEKICTLLSDDSLRQKMAQASRERYLQEFTFERFSERMRNVFVEVLDGVQANRNAGVACISNKLQGG